MIFTIGLEYQHNASVRVTQSKFDNRTFEEEELMLLKLVHVLY